MKPSPHEIALLMERFDFEKVERIMHSVNWVWIKDGKAYSPTATNLRETAERLAGNLEMRVGDCTATGGLSVEVMGGKEGKPYLQLEFIAVNSDTEYL